MLNHPTSSPMITRMLGFLSCAHAARADDKPMIAPINKPITKNLLLQACIEMYLLRSFPLLLQLEVESAMLVGCSDGLHEALDIHQRQGVPRMLKVGNHIVRRSAGKAFDVRKIHDGLVKLLEWYIDQRQSPAIVIAGVAAWRRRRHARAHGAVERHVVFLERIHRQVVDRADGAEVLCWPEPGVLGGIQVLPRDFDIGVLGIATDVGASACEGFTVYVNP